ncbi:Na+/H+-dicarboxylate symporter [Candidatus Kryptobacter tengchongensis]|nr:Na+/H+-dicarboxylate symporter [Candidatus Kryptobacter tengchongensis]
MFFKKPIPIHTKIIIALILGAIFGVIFSVDTHKLKIITRTDKGEVKSIVERWEKAEFILHDSKKEFTSDDQSKIIKFFRDLPKSEKSNVVLIFYKKSSNNQFRETQLIKFENIIDVQKVKTIAIEIKPIGTIFVRLLSFLAIPLVIASLIVGSASLGDIRKVGRIGGKTLGYYIITTSLAITIGLISANLIKPGEKISADIRDRIASEYQADVSEKIQQELGVDVIDFLVNIVPTNPINAMANGNMLQIVFFAVIFGLTLTMIDNSKSESVIRFFDGVSDTMIKMVDLVMKIAPYGVFALISATVAEFGFGILSTLLWYIVTVLIGLLIHLLGVYSFAVKFLGKMNPLKFFKGMRDAQIIAFSTSSSAATLPVNFECTERNLGVPKQITSFVLPLGATINMDGTALYQGVASVFIAQVYGFNLDITQQLTIVLTATLASIGTAPVPGVGIIMLVMILKAIHIPAEGIALILGVDRILDMCRTVVNITGDATAAVIVARSEGLMKNDEKNEV